MRLATATTTLQSSSSEVIHGAEPPADQRKPRRGVSQSPRWLRGSRCCKGSTETHITLKTYQEPPARLPASMPLREAESSAALSMPASKTIMSVKITVIIGAIESEKKKEILRETLGTASSMFVSGSLPSSIRVIRALAAVLCQRPSVSISSQFYSLFLVIPLIDSYQHYFITWILSHAYHCSQSLPGSLFSIVSMYCRVSLGRFQLIF